MTNPPLLIEATSQIDRLFAIWQAVNSGHWFDELPPEERVKATKALLPFRKYPLVTDPEKRFWSSNLAKEIEVLGYTYPELSNKQSAEQIRESFAKNYGWSRRLTPFQHFGSPTPEMEPLDLSNAQVYQYTSSVESASQFVRLTPRAEIQQVQLSQQTTTAEAKVSEEWYIDSVVER